MQSASVGWGDLAPRWEYSSLSSSTDEALPWFVVGSLEGGLRDKLGIWAKDLQNQVGKQVHQGIKQAHRKYNVSRSLIIQLSFNTWLRFDIRKKRVKNNLF